MSAILPLSIPLQSGGLSTFALGPIYLIAILVPGLLFYRGLMAGGNRYDTLSRLDKLGAALGGGAISWLPTLLFLRLFGYGPFVVGKSNGLTFLVVVVTLTVQMAVAYYVGEFVGDVSNRLFGETVRNFNDQQQPWDYASTKIREKEVTVVTDSFESPLHGIVARYSSFDEGGDLVLSPVSPESRIATGDESDRDKNNALYIERETISAVFFHDRDGADDYGDVLTRGDLQEPTEEEWKQVVQAAEDALESAINEPDERMDDASGDPEGGSD
ncbi:hypothetical protein [Halomicrobium sp. LC1Hm]|uniref:hypothetical protein n=1 Tax=Halomicrobium sp. LC1Hm TaxID=2610902 RepID=UPI0012984258|nr:hypothetical protein [Halomicrobium sp. LC1Hm]QGA82498.1 hypothetical protein LC1Hm_1450 [Halomicrobium sp. LC1Hm]